MIILHIDFVTSITTNSSSELFIGQREITIEETIDILRDILDIYNQTTGDNLQYISVFGDVNYFSKSDYLTLAYRKYWRKIYEIGETVKLEKGEYDWRLIEERTNQYIDEKWEEDCKKYEGKVTIYSASDNSIPYELRGLIEQAFEAERWHLG